MTKEQQIRVEIIPQLRGLVDILRYDEQSPYGYTLENIVYELTNILDKEND